MAVLRAQRKQMQPPKTAAKKNLYTFSSSDLKINKIILVVYRYRVKTK